MRPLSNIRLLVLLAAGILISVQPLSAQQRRGGSEQSSRRTSAPAPAKVERNNAQRNHNDVYSYNQSNRRDDRYSNSYNNGHNHQQAVNRGYVYAPNSGNRNDAYRNSYMQRNSHTHVYYTPPRARDESHLCYNPRYYQRGYVWVPGYWNWDIRMNSYIWVTGYWEPQRLGYTYYPGYWECVRGGVYIWISGGWFRA